MSRTPTPAQVRARAARWVADVAHGGRSLDDLLAQDSDEGPARSLRRALVYGTLRWHIRLRAILERLATRPVDRMTPRLQALLLVGLYQLEYGGTATHAAVAETVNAARELGEGRAAGFVNAVLRRFLRERDALVAGVDADLALRTAHPRWLVSALQADWPGQVEAILEANNAHPPFWLRVNCMRDTVDDCIARLAGAGLSAWRSELAPDALRVEPAVDVLALPGFAEGRVSVQDAAAQLAVELLELRPGQRILDACAAPGGKTCHVLERVDGRAEVVALDVSPQRLERVARNLGRLGLSAGLVPGDALQPAGWWDGRPFDRVLLDVPCSATGVIRRHPDIKLLRRATDVPMLAARQLGLLEALWPLLRPGGTLLYTSCSVLRAENAVVVGAFLEKTADAEDCTPARTAGWPARPAAAGPGYPVRPGEAGMDGFYYACLRKHVV